MNATLSRRLGAAFNAADPPPTVEQRREVVRVAQTATKFDDLPHQIQQLVQGWEGEAP